MLSPKDLIKINDYLWEIPKSFRSDMKVPGRVYLSEKMLKKAFEDRTLEQLVNATTYPGIERYALAMPDAHEGYGVPIGFVGGLRTKDGVISPGAIGYDINCLASQSRVLLEHGAYLSIAQLEKRWTKIHLKHLRLKKKELAQSPLLCFLKKYNNPSLYQIKTKTGQKIRLTGDHPVYTPQGMKKVSQLKEKTKIALYPFEGVEYQEPSKEIILTEEQLKRTLLELGISQKGNALNQVLAFLKKKDILPLRYNSFQLPYLLKIIGFVFGDGSISFVNQKEGVVWFYGRKGNLEKIREDILKINFKPSRIYQRKRNHQIFTSYKKNYRFKTTEFSFKVSSTAFAALLVALGTPYGLKTKQRYSLPQWIFKCPLWQKRLFLASLFGAELSSPRTINKYNFYAPQFNISKAVELKKYDQKFLREIKKLLGEFGIRCSSVREVPGYQYQGRQGAKCGYRLQILSQPENLLKFFKKVGYEYNQEKQKRACLAIAYLSFKQKVVELRTKIRKEARQLYKKGLTPKKIIEKLNNFYAGVEFICHSFWERRGQPRIAFNFPSFEDYIKKYAFGQTGLVWDEIEEIKKVPYRGWVYDLTIDDQNHNFIANNFVVSNCGVRVLRSNLSLKDLKPHLEKLMDQIQRDVPSGVGRGGGIRLSEEAMKNVLEKGVQYLEEKGYASKEDVAHCEEYGQLKGARAEAVSSRAKERGRDQLGTLGSGNHFLEIQEVEEIFDKETAAGFGLFKGQITLMIHSGSRGLGHQVCTDYIQLMHRVMRNYKIKLPDPELACVPFSSPEGQRYFSAMAASANFAWANRQMITYLLRKVWQKILGNSAGSLILIYDVAHNIAKIENHFEKELCVHRKGATRAFPAGHSELPQVYQKIGQPVLIPGTMGTASYILVGTEKAQETFFSVCHGAGRVMSRHAAIRQIRGERLRQELKGKGIVIRCLSNRGLAEEAPLAYKDIHNVVDVVVKAGLAKLVARLRPLGVLKG